MARHCQRVVQGGGVQVFGRQAVVDRHDRQPGRSPDLGADVVVAFKAADDKASAMQIDDDRGLTGIDPTGHAGHRRIKGGDPGRITLKEGAAHPVIDCPLRRDGQRGGVGRIGGLTLGNEIPGRAINQGGIVRHGHQPGCNCRRKLIAISTQ